MTDQKYCKYCKHFRPNDGGFHCVVNGEFWPTTDLVHATKRRRWEYARDNRGESSVCKPEGLLYEPKPTFWQRLMGVFK